MNRLLAVVAAGFLVVCGTSAGTLPQAPPVASLTAGYYHTCALLANNVVKCWGSNNVGQLADGTTALRRSAVRASSLSGSFRSLSGGAAHTCALERDRTVQCWGNNDFGQLGNGTTGERQPPSAVSGLSGVVALGAGGLHTCALLEGGGVKCWGDNRFGQLGDGTTTNRTVPVDVSGLTSGVEAIAVGGLHTCTLAARKVKCWGLNQFGELGDGTTANRALPVSVSLPGGVRAVAAGVAHTCALLDSGAMRCWGNNESGQLGNDEVEVAVVAKPVAVAELPAGVTQLVAGFTDTCALAGGAVYCWGELFDTTPEQVRTLDGGVGAITLAGGDTFDDHACAVLQAGGAKCWGANDNGQLGNGFTEGLHFKPAKVLGLADGVQVLTIVLGGHGTVRGTGIRCHDKCAYEHATGSSVALTAKASRGWKFKRWSGACKGRSKRCRVALNATTIVAARFVKRR